MNGEMAAAADIISGAAFARAVEPVAGEGHRHSDTCLNCGTALVGQHCHVCGQKADLHRTLSAFGHDILHSVLHFDGKIWRTLPMLFWRPSDLTRRYVHGERAKFVSPLALFLFTVFLTFATFHWFVPDDAGGGAERGAIQTQVGASDLEREGRKLQYQMAQLELRIADARKAGKPTQALEQQLASDQLGLRLMGTAANVAGQDNGALKNFSLADNDFPAAGALKKAAEIATKNPQLLLYKMQSYAYKYSWALIPISVPFVWLLFFWQRRFKMFDHAVFVTYSLTFMMLLGIICALLINFSATEVVGGFLLALAPPIHMYRHLKYAYGISLLGALVRMCMLTLFAMTALTLFAALIVALGLT